MFELFFERLAARKNRRFKVFVHAKKDYEAFRSSLTVQFEDMTLADYDKARNDSRLVRAKAGFLEAKELCEVSEQFSDMAVAMYEIGIVCHALGELHESEQWMRSAMRLAESIPDGGQIGEISGCLYHIGIIQYKAGLLSDAEASIRRSLSLDKACEDFQGVLACQRVLGKICR